MRGSPGRLLLELMLGAAALGGFCYGWNGRSEPSAMPDKQILELYQRMERMEVQNKELLEKVQEYEKILSQK